MKLRLYGSPVAADGSMTLPASIHAVPLCWVALVTNTPLPLDACSQVLRPSIVSGSGSVDGAPVSPDTPRNCTPAGVSTNGGLLAPCPANR